MSNKSTTPFDTDPIDSTSSDSNDSGGDEVAYDREMVIGELLNLEFDDDPPYTRAELDKMSDDQLCDLYNSEMFETSADVPGDDFELDNADEEVECCICGVVKICDFEDQDGEPICAECEESDDSPGEVEEEVDSETDEEGEEDSEDDEESSDDVDETEES